MSKAWLVIFILYLSVSVFVTTAGWLQAWLVNSQLLKRIHQLESEAPNET